MSAADQIHTGSIVRASKVLAIILVPMTLQAQVTIEEEVRIGSGKSQQVMSGGAFALPVALNKNSNSSAQSCAPSTLPDPDYIPCAGVVWGFYLGCMCDPSGCDPATGTTHARVENQDTSGTTFTWTDGTTDVISLPATETTLPGGGFALLAGPYWVVNETWWGVMDWVWSVEKPSGGTLCSWSVELPTDTDNDLIADNWEMLPENGGTLNLNAVTGSTDPDCLALGSNDACWDEEVSTDNDLDGDGITKMMEYQGVMIGDDHHRLDPDKKEVFIDISQVTAVGGDVLTAVEWAAREVEIQLYTETFREKSISGLKIEGSTDRFPGGKPLEWLGDGADVPGRGYIRVAAPQHKYPPTPVDSVEQANALVANSTVYYWGNTLIQNDSNCPGLRCQPQQATGGAEYGATQLRWEDSLFATVNVFEGTIGNLFDVTQNSVDEHVSNHEFAYLVAIPIKRNYGGTIEGSVHFRSYFDGVDADANGGVGDANPFDLLTDPRFSLRNVQHNDASTPGLITGLSELDILKRVALHELGHAMGIWTKKFVGDDIVCTAEARLQNANGVKYPTNHIEGCHPKFGASPMRSGFRPGTTTSFTLDDKATMQINRQ